MIHRSPHYKVDRCGSLATECCTAISRCFGALWKHNSEVWGGTLLNTKTVGDCSGNGVHGGGGNDVKISRGMDGMGIGMTFTEMVEDRMGWGQISIPVQLYCRWVSRVEYQSKRVSTSP